MVHCFCSLFTVPLLLVVHCFLAISHAEFLCVFVLAPKPTAPAAPSTVPGCNQIFCCAFNADGSIFVTGSSDKIARVIMLTLLVIQKYLAKRLSY